MKGEDLIKVIQDNDRLRYGDVKETIKALLKARLVNPSTLIDAQVEILEDEKYKLRCHFEDSVVSTIQLFGGNYKGEDYEKAKKRLFYNTSFSKQFPNMTTTCEPLTDEDKKEWSDFFETIYGFRPEEK
jgi:hypothetical protein